MASDHLPADGRSYTAGSRYRPCARTPRSLPAKLVFGAERRRASAYSLALRAAKKRGVTPEGLAAWLTKEGGIEEIRLSAAKPSEEPPASAGKSCRTRGSRASRP